MCMFFSIIFYSIFQNACYWFSGNAENNTTGNKKIEISQSNGKLSIRDTFPNILCRDLVQEAKNNDNAHCDSTIYKNQSLLFIVRDSFFYAYKNSDKGCQLAFKSIIEYDFNGAILVQNDKNALMLYDIDGDGQLEIFLAVSKGLRFYYFMVYKLDIKENEIVFNPIKRINEIVNPIYDKETGLIYSHLNERDYECEEYYKLDKNNNLIFIRGKETTDKGEKEYTQKTGW